MSWCGGVSICVYDISIKHARYTTTTMEYKRANSTHTSTTKHSKPTDFIAKNHKHAITKEWVKVSIDAC